MNSKTPETMSEREQFDTDMRYIDGDLWKIIQQFKQLGNYKSTRAAQQELAQQLQQIPLGQILATPPEKEEKNGTGLKI